MGVYGKVWEYTAAHAQYRSIPAARVVRKSPYQSVSVRTAAINRVAGLAPQSGGILLR